MFPVGSSHFDDDEHQSSESFEYVDSTSSSSQINYPDNSNQLAIDHRSDYQNSMNKAKSLEKQFNLSMDWATRDLIILNLNHLSALLLYGDSIKDDAKNRLACCVTDLILDLVDLPPWSNQQISTETPSKLTFQITSDYRNRLVQHLTKNKNYTVFPSSVPDKMKLDLSNENKNFIIELLDLKINPIKATCDLESFMMFNNGSNTDQLNELKRKFDELEERNERLRKRVDNLVTQNKQMGLKIENLEEKGDDLESQFECMDMITEDQFWREMDTVQVDLQSEIDQLKETIHSRGEAVFTYEIDYATSFLKRDMTRFSSNFYVRNLKWNLIVQSTSKDNKRQVGLFLKMFDENCFEMSIEVDYELRLISQTYGISNKTKLTNYTFKKTGAHGIPDFLSSADYSQPSKGFIKNDKIVVEVYLKAKHPSKY